MARGFAMFLVFLTVLMIVLNLQDEAEALTVVIYRRRRASNKSRQQKKNLKKGINLLKKALKVEKKALKVNVTLNVFNIKKNSLIQVKI